MGLFKRQLQAPGLCRLDNCNNSERSSSRKFIKTNEAPYQTLGRTALTATLGFNEIYSSHFWLSLLSECLSCYLYVFIVCSTRISWTGAIIGHEPNLLAMSLSSGRIPVFRALLYVIVHCVGAVAAIAFLYSISIKGHAGALGLDNPHDKLLSWQILIVEIVISFVVTLATYATCNYSSYTNAKKHILSKLGESSSLFPSHEVNGQHHSRRTVAPIVPTPPSTSITLLNGQRTDHDEAIYDYDYDNHRIYATQQLKSEASPQVSIEEVMQDECQLLAPNGFSLRVTSGQAFVIGMAYTLTSLSGIPASGASLNPARSFGPAFIMNRWDSHWIYWLGPILGAVIAGLFYEFIFSPTRKSSLCYRPKLFRLSALDIAKVGSKSRLYQHRQQKMSNMMPNRTGPTMATTYRPQSYYHQQIHQSPTTRTGTAGNLITNSSLSKSFRDPQLITAASVAHLQSPYLNTIDQMNYMTQHLQQQQQQVHDRPQTANFDRSKSSAILNSISALQHQSINFNNHRNNADLALSPLHSLALDGGRNEEQVVYDDPDVDPKRIQPQLRQFRTLTSAANHPEAANRRSLFQLAQSPSSQPRDQSSTDSARMIQRDLDPVLMNYLANKPINTFQRPHSMAISTDHRLATDFSLPAGQRSPQASGDRQSQHNAARDLGQLDDDLYHVLIGDREQDQLARSKKVEMYLNDNNDLTNQRNDTIQTSRQQTSDSYINSNHRDHDNYYN